MRSPGSARKPRPVVLSAIISRCGRRKGNKDSENGKYGGKRREKTVADILKGLTTSTMDEKGAEEFRYCKKEASKKKSSGFESKNGAQSRRMLTERSRDGGRIRAGHWEKVEVGREYFVLLNYEPKAWRNQSAVQRLSCSAHIACRHVANVMYYYSRPSCQVK